MPACSRDSPHSTSPHSVRRTCCDTALAHTLQVSNYTTIPAPSQGGRAAHHSRANARPALVRSRWSLPFPQKLPPISWLAEGGRAAYHSRANARPALVRSRWSLPINQTLTIVPVVTARGPNQFDRHVTSAASGYYRKQTRTQRATWRWKELLLSSTTGTNGFVPLVNWLESCRQSSPNTGQRQHRASFQLIQHEQQGLREVRYTGFLKRQREAVQGRMFKSRCRNRHLAGASWQSLAAGTHIDDGEPRGISVRRAAAANFHTKTDVLSSREFATDHPLAAASHERP